ncbi:hypothetical protein B0I35DRAFT_60212 [Stachybotrys elegans]|uniref:NACHT domain-containing protein n=1 Tax=Stachybotrys elegans TaxID=80388 RepID=A0A8K0WNV6_9HYPO|nr:hypothetical protein B0I35DRAFT_60212 [Stachybotrys elegans]
MSGRLLNLIKKRGKDGVVRDDNDRPVISRTQQDAITRDSTISGLAKHPIGHEFEASGDPLGLKVIYTPPGERRADIIFVHGLGGSSRKTWTTNKDPETFWPQKFLPQEADIKDARILSFGYNSSFRAGGASSKVSIIDFAKALLYDLKYAQDESYADTEDLKMGEKPIIFVVHSMGGLLFKEAYLLGQNDPAYGDIVRGITSVVFLSTPHRGTHLAETLNRILQVSFSSSPKQFIKELVEGSQTVERLNEQFRHVAPRLSIVSLYETRPTPIFKKTELMILEKSSSLLGYPGEISKPLDADHRGVCKYDSRDNPNYITVRNALKYLVGKEDAQAPGTDVVNDKAFDLEAFLDVTESSETDYSFFRDQWTNGTCEWLLREKAFASWANADTQEPGLLWIHGNAGTGKSVLSTFVIDHLAHRGSIHAYFFARYNNPRKQSLSFILRSMAFQIATQLPAYAARLRKLQAAGRDLKTVHFSLIWKLLYQQSLIQLPQEEPIYIVLDGLDEAQTPEELFRLFRDPQSESWPLRLLVVSRKTNDISLAWHKLERIMPSEEITLGKNQEDLLRYIRGRMDMADDEAYQGVIRSLLDRAKDNFLWVTLAVQRINECYTIEDMEDALTTLPPGMESLYDRMASTVQTQAAKGGKGLGTTILGWAVCAQRSLNLKELGDALSSEGVMDMHRTITDLCGGFVVIDAIGNVSLVHETARDYLTRARNDEMKPLLTETMSIHAKILGRCIARLVDPTLRNLVARKKPPALLDYAATHWFIHLSHCDPTDPKALQTAGKFLKGHPVLNWINLVVATGQLGTLVTASRYLRDVGHGASDAIPPSFSRDMSLISDWATDLVKIVGKFGDRLVKHPDSIYKLIPPFCPEASVIHQQFGRKEVKTLQVNATNNDTWDDCLSRFSIDEGLSASAVVTGGSHIAILATAKTISYIFMYDSQTFEKGQCMKHPERVLGIQLDPSGNILISYGFLTTRIWDTGTGECRKIVKNPPRRPRPHSIIVSDDGKRCVVASEDRCIRSLSLDKEEDVDWTLITKIEEEKVDGTILNFPTCSALSPDGTMVAYGYRRYPMTVWEIEPAGHVGHCIFDLDSTDMTIQETTFGEVFRVAWHPTSDEREVFGLTQVGLLFKWCPYEDFPSAKVHADAQNMAVSENGALISTANVLGTIKVFATSDLSMLYQFTSQGLITSITFSKDSRKLYDVRGTYGNVWQPDVLARIADMTVPEHSDHDIELTGLLGKLSKTPQQPIENILRKDNITTLAAQVNGPMYCYGTDEGVVHLCETGRGNVLELERLAGFTPIEKVAWSSDGKLVCIAQLGGKLSIKSVSRQSDGSVEAQKQLELQLPSHHGYITQLMFHCSHNQLLVSTPSHLFLVDVDSAELTQASLPENMQVRWVSHPALPDYLLGFGSKQMHAFRWGTLKSLESQTRTYFPPLTNRSGRVLETGEDKEQICNVESSVIGSSNVLLRLFPASPAGFAGSIYLIIDVDDLAESWDAVELSTLSSEAPATTQLSYTLIPDEVAASIQEPFAFISRWRLMFLDRDRWICTWRLAFATTHIDKGPIHERGVARGSGVGTASSSKSGVDGVERHYFLPGDWVTAAEAPLCTVMADGTLVCPRNGATATVQCSNLR